MTLDYAYLSCDVRSSSMNSLKDGAVFADVAGGSEAKSANEAGAQI
jgi:hypothetical protein